MKEKFPTGYWLRKSWEATSHWSVYKANLSTHLPFSCAFPRNLIFGSLWGTVQGEVEFQQYGS